MNEQDYHSQKIHRVEINFMIYHFYKADCYGASRVLMQSQWDGGAIFIHRSPNDDYRKNIKFGFNPVLQVMKRSSMDDAIVFHAQSSLPYLIISQIYKLLTGAKASVIYDIHDLHEWNPHHKKFSKAYLRYLILGALEHIAFATSNIKKMTVSKGLASVMEKKYGSPPPIVVRNSINQTGNIGPIERLENTVVFFGLKQHAPIKIISRLCSLGVNIHLYGRDMTTDWVTDTLGKDSRNVKVFGEYNPKDMAFLNKYKALIFYPNEITLNYKHSMPNKLFQAIDHGLCVIVSEYFEEIIQTFSNANECVYGANDTNFESVVTDALRSWTEDSCNQAKIIKMQIQSESKENYRQCLIARD